MTGLQRCCRLLARALRRRCPVCGQGPLFRTYFTPLDHCPACGFYYVRGNEYGQEGYFTGTMAINLVITGVVPLVVLFVVALAGRLSVPVLMIGGGLWTVLFPILFYPLRLHPLDRHRPAPPSAHPRRAGRPAAQQRRRLAAGRHARAAARAISSEP